jgi:hypothetical protein
VVDGEEASLLGGEVLEVRPLEVPGLDGEVLNSKMDGICKRLSKRALSVIRRCLRVLWDGNLVTLMSRHTWLAPDLLYHVTSTSLLSQQINSIVISLPMLHEP